MRLALRSQPATLAERAEALGDGAVKLVRSVPDRLDTTRKRALAVAGGAASAAAGFAFWRARHDDGRPSIHDDPAQTPAPWKKPPPARQRPVDTKAAATGATPARTK